jgi:hypothetical protein
MVKVQYFQGLVLVFQKLLQLWTDTLYEVFMLQFDAKLRLPIVFQLLVLTDTCGW